MYKLYLKYYFIEILMFCMSIEYNKHIKLYIFVYSTLTNKNNYIYL